MDIGSPTKNDEIKQADSKAAIGPASISKLELAEIGFSLKGLMKGLGCSIKGCIPVVNLRWELLWLKVNGSRIDETKTKTADISNVIAGCLGYCMVKF